MATAALALVSVPAFAGPAQAALVGGFEVDGNQVTDGNVDWTTLGNVSVVHDAIGNADASVFDGGDSENDNDGVAPESPWGIGSPGTPSGKSDIGNVLVGSFKSAGDTYAAFGWDRVGDTGTGRYYIELNQKASAGIMPDRTAGDVRIVVAINGSDLLVCQSVETWAGQWTNSQACGADFQILVNSGPITDYFDSPNVPLEANTFLEGVINLSDFGLTTCPVAGFQSIHFRSQEGGENGDTSSLKDFATGPIDIPSDCGSITIQKKVNGTLSSAGAGASFMISPDPTPGSSDPYLVVTTGSDGTVKVTAMPGETYTVQELAPPNGYLLPVDDTQQVTVGDSEQKTVVFNDVDGSLKFTKYYEGTPPTGEGASFIITRTHHWSYDTDPAGGIAAPALAAGPGTVIHVTDNGMNDADSTMGKIQVDSLFGGQYTIVETSPPPGWKKDPANSPVDFTIGPRDSNAQRNISLNANADPATFSNLLRLIAIKVVKTESVPGIPADTAYLPGVTFELYADDGDHVAELGGDDALVGSAVTDANGEISWTGLSWQKDYWLKEIKKTGYEIGLTPNPTLINVDQANPPKDDSTVITVPVDNPREEFSITLTKVDGSDHSVKLSGGGFQLWREVDGVPGLTAGDAMLASTPATDGEVTFSQNDLNMPWGYVYYVYESSPPTGYGLMSPNPIVVDATSPTVANTTIDLGLVEDPQLPVYLTLVKIVDNGTTDGTATVADFPLSASGPVSMTDVISGTPAASQQVKAGTYTLSEGSGPAGYTASAWSCVGNGDDGADGSVTLALGDDVTCTITNTAQPGTYVYSKSSNPVSGSTVNPGDTVTYTVTVTKTGGVDPTNVVVYDDLSDVFDNATLVSGSLSTSTGSASIVANQLTWTIPVLSGTATATYAVTVDADEWGVTLHNVVTSPRGSCDGVCETTHVTPHWTLFKTSDPVPGSTVMPGTQVDYTLTVHNDSNAVVSGATVTDDLSDVLDNATVVLPLDASLSLVSTTLTWTLPTLQPDDSATVSYSVLIGADEWGQTLHNVATPDQPSGECIEPGCETTHLIPPVTTLVVQKVDFESGASLAGATFQLWTDNAPYFNADTIPGNADDVIGAEDTTFGDPVVTDADGLAKWAKLLMGSHFIIEETVPPAGYNLPDTALMGVELNEQNFVPMGEMAVIQFRDPAKGQIAILSKKQFQDVSLGNASGNWQQIKGEVPFGERMKYEITIKATGNKMFHDVTVTDYVPGYNPKDKTSTNKAKYEAGSAACSGFTCTTHFDAATGLVTWYIGDVQNATGTVSFVVNFPALPNPVPYDANNHYEDTIWNVGYLAWNELDTSTSGPGLPGENVLHFKLTSNEVTATASADALPEEILPPTGSSLTVEIGGALGSGLVLLGAWLMAAAIRRRRLVG